MSKPRVPSLEPLRAFIRRTVVIQAIHAVAWILLVFALGLGVSLVVSPPDVVQVPTFVENFRFAPPHIWGIGFVVLGLWGVAALSTNPSGAPLPLYGLGVLTSVWGLFTLPAVLSGAGAVSAVWVYSAVAAICMVAATSISHQERA